MRSAARSAQYRLLVATLVACALACARDGADPPNVLLVVLDTLRADRLSIYGNPRNTSPNLDSLAREGLLFENAFAPAPTTVPSHASLFTSTYPAVHTAWNLVVQDGVGVTPTLPEASLTLAEVLRDAGYETAAFADGGWLAAGRGLAQGFQVFDSTTAGTEDRVTAALAWLEARERDDPFFLFLHSYEVHAPYLPPQGYEDAYAGDYQGPAREALAAARAYERTHEVEEPHDLHRDYFKPILRELDAEGRAFLLDLYDAELHLADEHFARLIDYLRLRGLWDETLILVTSDHGEEFGEHGRFEHTQMYREVTHIPLLVRAPGGPRGVRRRDPVDLVDLMPSILAFAGIDPPARMQGRVVDFRSAADGLPPRPLVSQTNRPPLLAVHADGLTAMFEGWKLERGRVIAASDREEQDITATPRGARFLEEARAIALRHREEGARLRAEHGLEPGYQALEKLTPERIQQLRALGYVK